MLASLRDKMLYYSKKFLPTSLSCVIMPRTRTSPNLAVLPKSASTVFNYKGDHRTVTL